MPANVTFPGYLADMVNSSRDAFCHVLHNKALWSDKMIQKTLGNIGGQTFDIEDVRIVVKEYLSCLADTIEKGDPL